MAFGSGFHHIVQRGNVGVKTTAHILQVKEQYVNILQLFSGRFFVFAIKRNNGQACKRILAGGDGRARLRLSAKTVFRAEQLHQINLACQQRIHQMRASDHGGLVAAQSHAFAIQFRQVSFHTRGPRAQCRYGIRRLSLHNRIRRLILRTCGHHPYQT